MYHTSDIPEWSMAESLGKTLNFNADSKDFVKMINDSPSMQLQNLQIPFMLLVGLKDRRCPSE
jgi:dipeptidyl aminopeptidase/acylaminoacyl peptidase